MARSRWTVQEFEELFRSVSNWGSFGRHAARGTLNYVTAEKIRAAASLVRSGRTVSLSLPLNTVAGPDNPRPVLHHMVRSHQVRSELGGPEFAADFIATEFHGDSFTHIDALCHISYQGRLFDGLSVDEVTSQGARSLDIAALAHGVVGRGVLLDIPRLRGVRWLEPGEAVHREELEAAERAQGVRVGEGDVLLFRTGHHRRRLELGPWNNGYDGAGKAGLHVDAIPFLHERKVAVFFPDGDGDTVPSTVEGVAYPIHALQIGAMGMICADSLQFEELVPVCEEERRWEMMISAAPLRLPGGTGSVFNPIAIL
ncbi:MAG TPA: cyclase family protein [Spirochaetia bacterium]|nr:cyclase family protein [Spirochaetia bacterium]